MSFLILISLYLGFPRVPVWEVLADKLNAPILIGWVAHFIIGIFLAAVYIFWLKSRLRGNDATRGMTFGLLPFILVQVVTLSLGGFDILLFLGSFVGHLTYGFVLGLITHQNIYACLECGLLYKEKKWVEKCEVWCKEHKSCNLDIISHAFKI